MPRLLLSQAAAGGSDNFLPLRHLAATLVLYGHSHALAFNPQRSVDLIAHVLPGYYAGNFAVYLFFAISGYLVTLSVVTRPGLWPYLRNRTLRVYPGYFACLLACVLVIGPLFTTLDFGAYVRAPGTWNYLVDNLLPISFAWTLPGVFADNPLPEVVNGTLWSLGLEVRWYFYLAVLSALTVLQRRMGFTLLAAALLAFGAWEWMQGKPDALEYRALSQTFLIGALIAHWRHRIVVSHAVMLGLAALVLLTRGTEAFGVTMLVALPYLVLWIAYACPRLRWPRGLDLSYGLFLYGYPVQQMLMACMPTLSPLALFAAALAGTLPLAWLSWMGIERPALRWKRSGAVEPAP